MAKDDPGNAGIRPPSNSTSEFAAPWWVKAIFLGLFGVVFALGVASTIFGIFQVAFLGSLFSLFGLLFLGGTVYGCVETLALVRRGASTDGIVVGFEERLDEEEQEEQEESERREYSIEIGHFRWSFGKKKRRVSHFPRVEFKTKDHEKRVFTSDDGSRKPSYRVGEVVRVLYDPARPQVARINKRLWAPVVAG